MMPYRILCLAVFFSLIASTACSASVAYVEGFVKDKDTGRPFENVVVEVFNTSSPNTPVASMVTDANGFYNVSVSKGNYEIFVRVGSSNPRQSVYVQSGEIQHIDFVIDKKSITGESITSNPMTLLQIGIAVLILLGILADQLFFRKRRVATGLAAETARIEREIKSAGSGVDDLTGLRNEKKQLEYMIDLTRTKYHQRAINEESFREIIRDYQEKLIEVEAKIAALESEKKA